MQTEEELIPTLDFKKNMRGGLDYVSKYGSMCRVMLDVDQASAST